MNKNKGYSFIILSGLFILSVFSSVVAVNLLPDKNESNSYYSKEEENIAVKVEYARRRKDKIIIKGSSNATMYCIKTTKGTPSIKSICWNSLDNNNMAETPIFELKKYYVWVKDNGDNISNYLEITK